MLPEPNPPKRAAAQVRPQLEVMTPLFSVPGGAEPDPGAPGRRTRPTRRSSARLPAPRAERALPADRDGRAGKSAPLKEPADLLAVTAERLRRALARSFLRYGIAGDLESAIHAAMNVVEPVLEARDTEILRLRRLMAGKLPAKASRPDRTEGAVRARAGSRNRA